MAVTTFTPAAFISAPVRTPFMFGLFSVINWQTPERWEGGGITWESDDTGDLKVIGAVEDWDSEIAGMPKDFDRARCIIGLATPFTVYSPQLAGISAFGQDETQARAIAALEANEEVAVEEAVWTGSLGVTPNFSGDPIPSTATAAGIAAAIIEAERWLSVVYGAQGIIHMPRALAMAAVQTQSLVVERGRLRTQLGTPVVAGGGYPDDDTIVVTGSVIGTRSEIFTATNTPGDLFDRGRNDQYGIAERTYAIGFDISTRVAEAPPIHKITVTEVAP